MAQAARKGEFTGWHMIMILAGAFSVVFAVNAVFVVAAIQSWTGEVDPQAYEKGLAYNETLAAREKQSDLGWSAGMTLDQRTVDAPVLTIRLRDRAGAPVRGAAVTAEIRRPTQEGLDRMVTFTDAGDGVYAVVLDLPLKGQWEVRADATRGTDRFSLRDRIVLR